MINHTQKLGVAILGGIIGGQMISKGLDSMGLYNIYNPIWNIALGLLILLIIAKYFG